MSMWYRYPFQHYRYFIAGLMSEDETENLDEEESGGLEDVIDEDTDEETESEMGLENVEIENWLTSVFN